MEATDSPRVVLGLGNPGGRYRDTRHNLGFRVVDRLARRCGAVCESSGPLARVAEWVRFDGPRGAVILAKPRTFMNRSGLAAASICHAFGTTPDRLLAVYDDVELELGRIRLRRTGSAGGHNGMRSLIEVLGTPAIPRLRLGVRGEGRDRADLTDYVLGPFDDAEQPRVEALIDLGAEALDAALAEGLTDAMNRYNARLATVEPPHGADGGEENGSSDGTVGPA